VNCSPIFFSDNLDASGILCYMFTKYRLVYTCSIGVFLLVCLPGQDLDRFNSNFQRDINKYGKSERTAGDVYYTPERIILNVTEPIAQWIIVHQYQTILYYPDQNKGIRLKSQQQSFVNFVNTFLASAQEDYNLSTQDFLLYENDFKGDSLYSYWQTDKAKVNFTLIHYDNRLVKVESRDEENNFFTSVAFAEHVLFAGRYYPSRMVFTQIYKGDKSKEVVIFSEICFNQSFPAEIENFTIPENAELKVLDW
jgi:outer membrane lipoprotein-sorting protein